MEACRQYLTAKGRRLSFEWALIDGVNDHPVDAAELAEPGPAPRRPRQRHPAEPDARATRCGDRLRPASAAFGITPALGVNATVRRNRGTDIDAACGQLAARPAAMTAATARLLPN